MLEPADYRIFISFDIYLHHSRDRKILCLTKPVSLYHFHNLMGRVCSAWPNQIGKHEVIGGEI